MSTKEKKPARNRRSAESTNTPLVNADLKDGIAALAAQGITVAEPPPDVTGEVTIALRPPLKAIASTFVNRRGKGIRVVALSQLRIDLGGAGTLRLDLHALVAMGAAGKDHGDQRCLGGETLVDVTNERIIIHAIGDTYEREIKRLGASELLGRAVLLQLSVHAHAQRAWAELRSRALLAFDDGVADPLADGVVGVGVQRTGGSLPTILLHAGAMVLDAPNPPADAPTAGEEYAVPAELDPVTIGRLVGVALATQNPTAEAIAAYRVALEQGAMRVTRDGPDVYVIEHRS